MTTSRRCYSALSLACIPLANCAEGAVRLVDKRSPLEGRVEICVNGFWGVLPIVPSGILSYYTIPKLPRDICKQLGLPWEWALQSYGFSGSYPLLLNCTSGDEHCYRPSCRRSSGYGVICQGNTSKPRECENFDIRLVNGSKKTEGRLELCANGYWSNVCIDYYNVDYTLVGDVSSYWNHYAAKLVCRKLGFPTEVTLNSYHGSPYGSNPSLPLVTVDCGKFDPGYSPVVDDIATDCSILNRCSPRRSIIGVSCRERTYFNATVEIVPAQESYEIGTEVTLRCIPPPMFTWRSPSFHWYSTSAEYVSLNYRRGHNNISFVIPAHFPALANYYCFVYEGVYPSQYLLGRGRTTIKTKGVLQRNINEEHVQVQEQDSVHLQVEMLNINATRLLSDLTWYRNGEVILPDQDERIILSNDNKTLIVNNFTSADAGVYRAQFNRISVEPFNQSCNDKLIPLLRSYPVLAPAIFCINVSNTCAYNDSINLQRVSIQRLNFMNASDVDGLSLEAIGIINTTSREEFDHLSLRWYLNGGRQRRFVEHEWRQYPTISQRLIITDPDSEIPYEFTGRYEVALTVNLNEYLGDPDSTCQALYNSIDLYLDTEAATRDEGATLTCRASIPFSMLSLIKNGQIVATLNSSGGTRLEINSRNVNANPFGVYTCQLNASGEIFEKTVFLKEQVNIKLMIEKENQRLCNYTTESIEEALFSKISTECQCDFSRDDFNDSSLTNCEESGELTYKSTIQYSNSEGFETASVIVHRLSSQAPFLLIVEEMPVRVTAVVVDCADCKSSPQPTSESISPSTPTFQSILSPATVSGLFVGGFATGVLIVFIIIIILMIIIIGVRKYRQSRVDDESKLDKKVGTLTSQSVPTCPIGNDEENIIELKEK